MRYRLRTLLIVVTIVCVPLAWIAWLKQQSRSNRRELARRASNIATVMSARRRASYSAAGMEEKIAHFGRATSATKWVRAANQDGEEYILFTNFPYHWVELPDVDVSEYAAGVYHAILADRYARAQFRPWVLVCEPKVTKEAVYVPLSDDAWYSVRGSMVEIKKD